MIALIGAGTTGCSFAHLHTESCRGKVDQPLVIFDKGRRAGGRASTYSKDKIRADYGASLIRWKDQPRSIEALSSPEMSVHQLLVSLRDKGILSPLKSPLHPMSGAAALHAYEQGELWVARQGLTPMLLTLIEDLEKVELRLSHHVQKLTYRDEAWWVEGRLGTDQTTFIEGPFSQVVLTMPPEQSAALLQDIAPELAVHVQGADPFAQWAVIAQGSIPWLADYALLESPIDEVSAVFARISHEEKRYDLEGLHGQSTYVLQAKTEWSAKYLFHSKEDIECAFMSELKRLDELWGGWSSLSSVKIHRWRLAGGLVPGQQTHLSDPRGLILCGDAYRGRAYDEPGGLIASLVSAASVVGSLL